MSKELKALERVKNFMSNNAVHWKQDIGYIETALKALEIIKEKQVNIAALLELDSLQQYNDYCDMVGGCKKLTQEEYDILKEVLL